MSNIPAKVAIMMLIFDPTFLHTQIAIFGDYDNSY